MVTTLVSATACLGDEKITGHRLLFVTKLTWWAVPCPRARVSHSKTS